MANAEIEIRAELMNVIAAIGFIGERAASLAPSDAEYFDRELARIQSAAHRLLEHLDACELQRN